MRLFTNEISNNKPTANKNSKKIIMIRIFLAAFFIIALSTVSDAQTIQELDKSPMDTSLIIPIILLMTENQEKRLL